ncbi:GNAT family N-acetyltransferase [Mesorhizobium sp. ZMM04-5]|uniref:GNAT family N-acetyltransferase n=1 Tax=Mesorhizobium marinum TaxID=3228790 RepID=A0ABV3QZY7_9HYPH
MLQRLETERFVLRPLGRVEAYRIGRSNWNHDQEIMRNLIHSAKPLDPWRWLKKMVWVNGKTKFSYAIVPRDGGEPIGIHGMTLQKHRSATLVVAIHDRAYWGKQVVAEIRRAIIDHAFEHGVIDRLCCTVNARNIASVFNYKKLGFRHVGTLHQAHYDPVSKELFDTLIFELLKSDWQKQRMAHA